MLTGHFSVVIQMKWYHIVTTLQLRRNNFLDVIVIYLKALGVTVSDKAAEEMAVTSPEVVAAPRLGPLVDYDSDSDDEPVSEDLPPSKKLKTAATSSPATPAASDNAASTPSAAVATTAAAAATPTSPAATAAIWTRHVALFFVASFTVIFLKDSKRIIEDVIIESETSLWTHMAVGWLVGRSVGHVGLS